MELVAFVGSDSDTVSQVSGLIKKGDWDKILLVCSGTPPISEKPVEVVNINSMQRLVDLKEEIKKRLQGKIKGTEVALSIASGNGKEHMALISALLSVPVGIRFSALTKDGIVEL